MAAATVGAVVVVGERRWAPLPDGAWPLRFERVHDLGMFAAASLVALVATEIATNTVTETASGRGSPDVSSTDDSASVPSES